MENFKWLHLLYAVILISTAQVIVWFQHNWQFINPKMKPEWWGWYVVAIPITWMFLKGTYYGVTAFDGDLWPNSEFIINLERNSNKYVILIIMSTLVTLSSIVVSLFIVTDVFALGV